MFDKTKERLATLSDIPSLLKLALTMLVLNIFLTISILVKGVV
jgi:hypothetical protein